jgi:8-oxo-dGTP pyrophosphatase MutT (NUDIX family)
VQSNVQEQWEAITTPMSTTIKQSAAIPFRQNGAGEIEVLLVTSRTGKRWVLPKGRVPRGMPAFASAAREAHEEAGVIGDVAHAPIGFYHAKKLALGVLAYEVQVAAYPLEVWSELEIWPEMTLRQRSWFPLQLAMKKADNPGIRAVLRTFGKLRSTHTA